MRQLTLLAALLLLAGSLAGCGGMLAPKERKGGPMALPGSYSEPGGEQESALSDAWWKTFDSRELDELMDTALRGNFDVRTAWARLRQARAASTIADADLYPHVNLEGSAVGDRSYSQTTSEAPGMHAESERWRLGFAASYEVDLWGKYMARSNSEELAARAAADDVASAAMTVAGEVATNWVDLLATRAELEILREQIEVNAKQLDLQFLRFRNGLATALDVTQQKEILAGSKAEMPLLLAEERVLRNELAYLVGRSSPEFIEVTDEELPELIPLPETGLPVQLLENRPDVRAAFSRLKAGDWDVAAARADRLPSISLSAEALLSSSNVGFLFNNWAQQIAVSLLGPIIDGGARAAEVRRQRALVDEYMADYVRVVANAVREVEDALVREARQAEYIQLLQEQLEAATMARSQARLRYLQGQSDYLPLLTEILNVQQLERQLVTERARRITYRIALYRALGGDWTGRLTPDGLPAEIAGHEADGAVSGIALDMGADLQSGSRQ